MVYKIGLVSTHGTGKTALKGLVEGGLNGRSITAVSIREMSTKAREQGFPINLETSLEAQMWILHSQFAGELFYSIHRPNGPNYEVLICDRGPDNYCYLKHKFGENKHALDMTLGHIRQWPYSRLYLLPIVEASIVENDVRCTDKEFQIEMDQEIRTFLQEHHLPCEELTQPTKEDVFRNQWAKTIVNNTLRDFNKPQEYFIP